MPLSGGFTRSGPPRLYLPGYRSATPTQYNQMLSAYERLSQQEDFEPGQVLNIATGRAEINANEVISMAIKAPAYALEAPLRPLNVATGGLVGDIAKGTQEVVSKVPVLSNVVGALGEGLQWLDNVGASLPNSGLAHKLAMAKGKPDNYRMTFKDTQGHSYSITAGEIRQQAMERWSVDFEGNEYSLADLEARASANNFDFGQFATSSEAGWDFAIRMAMNPLNALFVPGVASGIARAGSAATRLAGSPVAAGARYAAGYAKAQSWARPLLKPGGFVATPFRYGYGYARSLGRGIGKAVDEAHNPNPFDVEFMDVTSSAYAVAGGELAKHGTLRSVLTASSWMARGAKTLGRKVFFPGLNTNLRGARLVGAGARAWMRGGIQQEVLGIAAEGITGGLADVFDGNVVGGTAGWLHDITSKVNNDHPLSDTDMYTLAAFFMPWSKAAREIVGAPMGAMRKRRLPYYTDNVATRARLASNKAGTSFKNNDEFFEAIGNGDIQRGRDAFEWYTDFSEVRKVENQLSHLTQQVADADLDGLAARNVFIGDIVRQNIQRRRAAGALQPQSTVDYMLDLHNSPGQPVKGAAELRSEVTMSGDSFVREIGNLYEAHSTIGPQMAALGLNIEKGGILSREIMDGIIAHFDLADNFDQALAREIMDMGPSLIYENDFWRQFSVTLGERQRGGRFRKSNLEAEGLTKEEVREQLISVRDSLPSSKELFHETLAASRAQGTARNNVFRIKEPPYPMGAKLKANRAKATGRTNQLAANNRSIDRMRTTEFFKSGKPKFGTAKEIAGVRGGVFSRADDGSYVRSDGVSVTIDGGAVRIQVPATKEAELLADLKKTIFKSGPRKGQIKPGMEAESQRLNLEIEAVRLGIDEEALILATQHGGRVIVSDIRAGDLLARRGYVESARIRSSTELPWRDPGAPPKRPDGKDIFDPDPSFSDPGFEDHRKWSDEFRIWEQQMLEGVMRGKITMENAVKAGLEESLVRKLIDPRDDSFKAMYGDRFYHATTDMRGVRATGLRTRKDVQRVGLGGGPDNLVSATYSKEAAERIVEVYKDMHEFLNGRITMEDLAGRLPDTAKSLLTTDSYWRRALDARTKPTVTITVGGKKITEPRYNKTELEEIQFEAYRAYLRAERDIGKMDPNLVSFDAAQFIRKADPSQIGLVEIDIPEGTLARHISFESELRLAPGSFRLSGSDNRAAYSWRGGDPTKLVENQRVGAFGPYRPTRRVEATERAAIGVARGDARRASLLLPSTEALGASPTAATSLWPEERLRLLQEQSRSTRSRYKVELKEIDEMDSLALEMLPFDRKITEMDLRDWVDTMTRPEMEKFRQAMVALEDYPALSVSRAPKITVDPAESRFSALVTQRNRIGELFQDYGPLSPIQRFYDALLAPKHSRWLGKQAQTELHNLMTAVGVPANATKNFVAAMKKEILDSKAVVGFGRMTGHHSIGSIAAIPEGKLQSLGRDLFPEQHPLIMERYGTYQKMLTESSNRLLRTVQRKTRSGGKPGSVEHLADSAMRIWQYGPVFEGMSGTMQRIVKYWYPLLRFSIDPLFAFMNWTEPFVYNILNNGYRGLIKPGREAQRGADLASSGIIPPGGLYGPGHASYDIELLLADPGFYTLPKNIRPNMVREFELKTKKAAQQYFEAMGPGHPIASMFRQRFGDNVKDWADEMYRLMNNFAEKGPEATVRAEWKAVLEKELGWTTEELKKVAPVAERLTEVYRGIYADLADLYVARLSRSNIERLANNFFLLWPVSYLIKASAWAYRVLFEKIGPVPGSVGAYAWDQYRQKYENLMENDPEMRLWAEENEDFLFMAELMFPISPANMGVSVARPTRYAGSWLAKEAFGQTDAFGPTPETLPEALEGTFRFGPIRTFNAASDILESWEVPGFYREPRGNQPPPYAR